jgi:hypothetical protein
MKKQQYIAHRLGRLNPHVVDRIYQMCVNDDDDDDDDALQILPGPSTAVDNRAASMSSEFCYTLRLELMN